MNGADGGPRRLVVRMPNWLGDAVMALPALAWVRAAFPEALLALAALPSIAPVFEEQTRARPQQIVVLDKASESSALRAGAFDTVLLFTNSFRSAWVARSSGIPQRWGYAAGARGPLLTRAVRRPRQVHQSEFYLQLVQALLTSGRSPERPKGVERIDVTAGTQVRARRLLDQYGVGLEETLVGFAPGAAYGHAKRWPPERVAAVVARLTREHGVRCVLVGAAADREAGRAIESALPPDSRVVNLIGRTDLRLLMGVLRACRAFVSNDSGAMHLAAAVGVPVTALFGPTKAEVTAPLGDHDILRHQVFCSPCMLRECPIDHRCMKRITTDEVYGAVVSRIGAGKG